MSNNYLKSSYPHYSTPVQNTCKRLSIIYDYANYANLIQSCVLSGKPFLFLFNLIL